MSKLKRSNFHKISTRIVTMITAIFLVSSGQYGLSQEKKGVEMDGPKETAAPIKRGSTPTDLVPASISNTDSDNQLMNLDSPTGVRFKITDIQWPENIGEASVCLWNDDKTAAASISIDDNIESDHEWWLAVQDKIPGIKFTWYVIDSMINPANWYKYQKLVDEGNDVQGHGRCAINDLNADLYSAALDATIEAVETNIPGTQCLGYAYPCGDPSKKDIAREKFIVMRGGTGLINLADKTDYLNLRSRSAPNKTSDVDVILREEVFLWSNSYYRGWLSIHYHKVQEKNKTATEAFLEYLSLKSDSVWIGTYNEIAKYGQSRDTHALSIDDISNSEIKFTLTDKMHDKYFDFPLSVKIRIDNNWTNVAATQNGQPIEVKVINSGGNQYALVKAVPDRGQVVLTGEGGTANGPIAVTGVNISQESAEMEFGESLAFLAYIEPEDADNQQIRWMSDNATVATVDANGLVTAISNGSASITVTTDDGKFNAICTVSVTEAMVTVEGVTLEQDSLSIEIGQSLELKANVTPAEAMNKSVIWKSGNNHIATVDENGLVKAIAAGTTSITATTNEGNFSASCRITVYDNSDKTIKVSGIEISVSSTSLKVGQITELTVTVAPGDASDKTVSWYSDDTSIATVNEHGKLTAVSIGSAQITVESKDGGFTASCDVIVKEEETNPITGIDVKNNSAISFWPNPVSGNYLYIEATGMENGETTICFNDISGEMVLRKQIVATSGTTLYSINIQDLMKGIYILHVKSRTNSFHEKIIVEK